MRVTLASVPARDGRRNEDFVGATSTAAVLVDGAGVPGAESVCRHGVAWYATHLGGSLLGLSSLAPERSLPALLAEAIEQVTDQHRDTCDVTDPISPFAAVAMLRASGGVVEHLVLGDAFVVLDQVGGTPVVVTDPREVTISRSYQLAYEATVEGSDERRRVLHELRACRNAPGGFWVAKDDPAAAAEAVTGSCPASELTSVALLSNGASRFVDQLGLGDWPDLMAVLASEGPSEIIRRVRGEEAKQQVAADDATIACCTDLGTA
jgi:hypothetical protein